MSKIKWDKVSDRLGWNKVKSVRKARKLTQPEVAVGAGISISTLWMVEQGYEEKLGEGIKKKLAKFFKCDVDDIFPAEMVGNEPRKKPREKTIAKMQFFAPRKIKE